MIFIVLSFSTHFWATGVTTSFTLQNKGDEMLVPNSQNL